MPPFWGHAAGLGWLGLHLSATSGPGYGLPARVVLENSAARPGRSCPRCSPLRRSTPLPSDARPRPLADGSVTARSVRGPARQCSVHRWRLVVVPTGGWRRALSTVRSRPRQRGRERAVKVEVRRDTDRLPSRCDGALSPISRSPSSRPNARVAQRGASTLRGYAKCESSSAAHRQFKRQAPVRTCCSPSSRRRRQDAADLGAAERSLGASVGPAGAFFRREGLRPVLGGIGFTGARRTPVSSRPLRSLTGGGPRRGNAHAELARRARRARRRPSVERRRSGTSEPISRPRPRTRATGGCSPIAVTSHRLAQARGAWRELVEQLVIDDEMRRTSVAIISKSEHGCCRR
jgi:hypothetical protein